MKNTIIGNQPNTRKVFFVLPSVLKFEEPRAKNSTIEMLVFLHSQYSSQA